MSLEELAALILSLPDVKMQETTDSTDCRVGNRIFATLPKNMDELVLKLTLDQQAMVVAGDPRRFAPVEGGWGNRGWTTARISKLDEAEALSALSIAWTNTRLGQKSSR